MVINLMWDLRWKVKSMVDSELSEPVEINSDVSQGSVKGPLMYIYINDFPADIQSNNNMNCINVI